MLARLYTTAFRNMFDCRKILLLLIPMIMSCSKEKELDRDILKIKNNSNSTSYVLSGNSIDFNGNTYNETRNYLRVALKLSEESKSKDTIFATINPELINEYNIRHAENNEQIPAEAFAASGDGAFAVPENSIQSTDSLYVRLLDASQLKNKFVYLVPVQLRTKSGAKLQQSVIYFKIIISKGQLTARFDGGLTGPPSGTYTQPPSYYAGILCFNYTNRITRADIPNFFKFKIALNTPFSFNDVNVSATPASWEETAAYAAKLNVRFDVLPLPEESYSITKNDVIVPAGSRFSPDSIVVTLKNKEKILANKNYFLGLKIKKDPGLPNGVPAVANDSCMAYIRLQTF